MNSRRLLIALIVALLGGGFYYCQTQVNPVTGEKQHVALSPADEVALGLQSAPEMARQFGGVFPDRGAAAYVKGIGQRVVSGSDAKGSPYPYDFHLLADGQTVNAFALPGGQVFLTAGLLRRLDAEGQLAAVLAHEIGHVVHRHSAEHLAKQQFTQVLVGAAAVAGSDDSSAGRQTAAIAAMVGDVVNLEFSRADELEADAYAVRALGQAGYDPHALLRLMEILQSAGGGASAPEFLSTHPDPGDRITKIQAEIARLQPDGVPADRTEGDAAAFSAMRARVAGEAADPQEK
jgi:predicted Zn-dependent protease